MARRIQCALAENGIKSSLDSLCWVLSDWLWVRGSKANTRLLIADSGESILSEGAEANWPPSE